MGLGPPFPLAGSGGGGIVAEDCVGGGAFVGRAGSLKEGAGLTCGADGRCQSGKKEGKISWPRDAVTRAACDVG